MIDNLREQIKTLFLDVFDAFFHPTRLTRVFQIPSWQQRLKFMLGSAIPMLLVACLITGIIDVILLFLRLLKFDSLLPSIIGIADGLTFGVLYGIMYGITEGIVGGVVFSITVSIAIGIAFGRSGDIPIGIAVGIAVSIVVSRSKGITLGFAVGIAVGLAGGIAGGTAGGIAVGFAVGFVAGFMGKNNAINNIAIGIVLSIVISIAGTIREGIMVGVTDAAAPAIALITGFVVGVYRLHLYLISAFSFVRTYIDSRKRPQEALQLLQRSSLHWGEPVHLPLLFLKKTLLIACDQSLQETHEEIAFIKAEQPQQLRAAHAVMLEITMRNLEECKTIPQVASVAQRLNMLQSPKERQSDPRWAQALSGLSDASREIESSMRSIRRREQLKSLDTMIKKLDKIRPNIAFFPNQNMNRRLKQVIETWRMIASKEHERIKNGAQDIGDIDNPYKPGAVLEPDDYLSVGRRDLAVQLEYALSSSRRPTLLLQGERHMGKTSTLRKFSRWLGPLYIPIVYNLQDPQIYAGIITFLGVLASEIYEELSERGIEINSVPSALSPEERIDQHQHRSREPMAYRAFDQWLKKVEAVLDKEDRKLLLAFDEFEKLDEASERGNLDLRLFLDWCRQIIQYRPNIILLFSGVRTFSSMGEKTGLNWSNYFVNVQTLKVSFLKKEEASYLIHQPRPGYPGKKIFGAVVEEIIQQTNCHPFLVQALCSQLIDMLNVENRERVESADVPRAVKQVIESWDGYFHDLWKRCDEAQRACLLALDAQEEAEGMTLNDIRQHSQLDEKSIRQTLRTLVSRDLVIDNEDGTYRIAAPIFRRWVKYNS